MQALMALGKSAENKGVPQTTLSLVHMRVSQINGCAPCLESHLRHGKDTEQRMITLAVWHDAPFFTEPERAALALAEAVTRIADRPDAVSDEIWAAAAKHFNEQQLEALVLMVGVSNFFNRINTTLRVPPGTAWN